MTFARDAVLDDLEAAGELVAIRGVLPAEFTDVTDDSRRVVPGGLFVAVRGRTLDGHDFLAAAAAAGATAAIVEEAERSPLPSVTVRDGRRAAGIAAAAAFGHPARALQVVGVTGTNGKTTTVGVLRHLLSEPTAPAASIGTLGVLTGSPGASFPGGGDLTTPGPVAVQRILRGLADTGVRRVAMEVSSHSLDQQRVAGTVFAAAVFTNLTRDHLDYHGSMEAYVAAKSRLLDLLSPDGVAVVNADEPAWGVLAPPGRTVTFALGTADADVTARDVHPEATGSHWTLAAGRATARVRLPLLGDFNVANALGAAATAWAMGFPLPAVAARLASVPQVPGRLERLLGQPTVLRDYAHTPDALERVLRALRPFVRGRLIVVFGCGGDRDRGKRPLMGGIAEREADVAIATSDNPRTENPEAILDDIERGMTRPHERIEDRRIAIARALDLARPDDAVLLAGKGHETYQIRGTTRLPFDEREIVRELATAHGGAAA